MRTRIPNGVTSKFSDSDRRSSACLLATHWTWTQTLDAGDVHDRPRFRGPHAREHSLHNAKGAVEVDLHLIVGSDITDILDSCQDGVARVVDEHINTTEEQLCVLDVLFEVGGCNIERDPFAALALDLCDEVRGLGRLTGRYYDMVALSCGIFGEREA
jgi:hypothetical protein